MPLFACSKPRASALLRTLAMGLAGAHRVSSSQATGGVLIELCEGNRQRIVFSKQVSCLCFDIYLYYIKAQYNYKYICSIHNILTNFERYRYFFLLGLYCRP